MYGTYHGREGASVIDYTTTIADQSVQLYPTLDPVVSDPEIELSAGTTGGLMFPNEGLWIVTASIEGWIVLPASDGDQRLVVEAALQNPPGIGT